MKYCYLCDELLSYIYCWQTICDECQHIRRLTQLYGKRVIINTLEQELLCQESLYEKKQKAETKSDVKVETKDTKKQS